MNILNTRVLKFVFAVSLAASAVISLQNVQAAENGFYVAARAGNANIKSDLYDLSSENVFTSAIAVGYQLPIAMFNIRGEGSYTYFGDYKSSNDYANIKIKGNTFLVSGYFDFYPIPKLSVYGTAGLGFSKIKQERTIKYYNYHDSSNDSSTSWQIGVGAAFDVIDSLKLDVSYRYTVLGYFDDEYGEKSDDSIHASSVMAGLTYIF